MRRIGSPLSCWRLARRRNVRSRAQWPARFWGRGPLTKLALAFQSCSVMITLDELVHDVDQICPDAQIFPVALSDAHSPDMDMAFLSFMLQLAEGSALGVYLLINSLPHWQKMKQVCDGSPEPGNSRYRRVRHAELDRLRPRKTLVDISTLQTFFPAEEYLAQLKLLRVSRQTDGGSQNGFIDAYASVPLPMLLHLPPAAVSSLTLIGQAAGVVADHQPERGRPLTGRVRPARRTKSLDGAVVPRNTGAWTRISAYLPPATARPEFGLFRRQYRARASRGRTCAASLARLAAKPDKVTRRACLRRAAASPCG